MLTPSPKWNRSSPHYRIHGIRCSTHFPFVSFAPICYSFACSRNAPMSNVRLPLFPLNVVLLPGADLPLHIFEPRYRQMVRECLDTQTLFGMLLALPDGIAGTGCSAEILEVTKRYPDGRS